MAKDKSSNVPSPLDEAAPMTVAPASGTETAGASPQALDPEIAARIASLRSHVRESFGKVVMAMMMLPRYRQQTLADLQHLVLEPLIRDRIAIAERSGENAAASDIAGVAIWASLSDEAEGRLMDQVRGGNWPLKLRGEDWNSGTNNWLIDVIAPDQKATANVIANFGKVVKDGSLKLHPLVARLVDEETLKKLGAHKAGAAATETETAPEQVPEGATVN